VWLKAKALSSNPSTEKKKKKLLHIKRNSYQNQDNPHNGRVFARYSTDKESIPRICKELGKLNSKEQIIQLVTGQRTVFRRNKWVKNARSHLEHP
jgi:hypothetical protein